MSRKIDDKSIISFVLHQAKSVLYPYITFSIIYIILERGNGIIDTVSFNGIGALWFLPVYFVGTVITFILLKTYNTMKYNSIRRANVLFVIVEGGVLLVAVICSYFIQCYFLDDVWNKSGRVPIVHISRILMAIFAIGMGVIYNQAMYYLKKLKRVTRLIIGIITIIGGSLFSFTGRVNFRYGYFDNIATFLFAGIMITYGLLIVTDQCKDYLQLRYVGRNTLIIFGLQNIVVKITSYASQYIENHFECFCISLFICSVIMFVAVVIFNKTKIKCLIKLPD